MPYVCWREYCTVKFIDTSTVPCPFDRGWSCCCSRSLWIFSSISKLLDRDLDEGGLFGSEVSTFESDDERALDSDEVEAS